MKKKLLITLGDSWTEGVGCYSTKDLNELGDNLDLKKFISSIEFLNLQNKNFERFHHYGWPNRLGKKLGYDKVINLSRRGSSNSGQLKMFFNYVLEKDFSDYEVLVIWMMTEPSRISFYVNGEVKDFMVNDSDLSTSYYKLLNDSDADPLLEQIFYMKCMEQLCENNNFKLLFTYWNITAEQLHKLYKSKYYLNSAYTLPIPLPAPIYGDRKELTEYYSPICKHPNERGYEIISNKIFNSIQENHPQCLGGDYNANIEWEWCGEG